VTKTLPFPVAYAVGAACEAAWTVLPLKGEPPLTRFLAEQLSTTHWYDMTPATRDFGYRPRVSIDEGLARLAESYTRRS
jgi:nucleoside-diphosphate-sugar epimerase